MGQHLLTARQPDGRVVTEWIEAASGDEAVERLRQRGCTEIVYHIEDFYPGGSNRRKASRRVSAQEYLAMRHGHGFLARLKGQVIGFGCASWGLVLVSLAVLVSHRVLGRPWSNYDNVSLVGLALPFVLACIGACNGLALPYQRMVDAACWGRWEEVLQWLPVLRGQIPPHEVAVREAQASAGLGCLEEGLLIVQPFFQNPEVPEWLYWNRLTAVYDAARQWESSVAAMERAFQVAPDNPTVVLDLAYVLLRDRQDTAQARPLLEQARRHALNEVLEGGLARAEGMLAWEEGRAREAIPWFEKAKARLLPFHASNPVVRAVFDQMDAYLALAHAACGHTEAAAQHFGQAEPRLRVLGYDRLLQRCLEVVKLPPLPDRTSVDSANPYQSPGT